MNQKLPSIEHLPPMRIPLFWKGEIRVVGHIGVWNFLLGPEVLEIAVPADCPLVLSSDESASVVLLQWREKPPTINPTL